MRLRFLLGLDHHAGLEIEMRRLDVRQGGRSPVPVDVYVVENLLQELHGGARLAPPHAPPLEVGRVDVLDDVDPTRLDVRPQEEQAPLLVLASVAAVVDDQVERSGPFDYPREDLRVPLITDENLYPIVRYIDVLDVEAVDPRHWKVVSPHPKTAPFVHADLKHREGPIPPVL